MSIDVFRFFDFKSSSNRSIFKVFLLFCVSHLTHLRFCIHYPEEFCETRHLTPQNCSFWCCCHRTENYSADEHNEAKLRCDIWWKNRFSFCFFGPFTVSLSLSMSMECRSNEILDGNLIEHVTMNFLCKLSQWKWRKNENIYKKNQKRERVGWFFYGFPTPKREKTVARTK